MLANTLNLTTVRLYCHQPESVQEEVEATIVPLLIGLQLKKVVINEVIITPKEVTINPKGYGKWLYKANLYHVWED